MLLYCGDVGLGCQPYSLRLLLECITYTVTTIQPVTGVGVRGLLIWPLVFLRVTVHQCRCCETAAVTACKHREAAPARLSRPQHHTDENSWWECVHNTQRLLRITPPPQTHSHSFLIQNGRKALIWFPKVFRRGEKGNRAFRTCTQWQ